ncbi:hypothetical protein B0H19DRAFT_1194353, partial [Mycena capillaripes]
TPANSITRVLALALCGMRSPVCVCSRFPTTNEQPCRAARSARRLKSEVPPLHLPCTLLSPLAHLWQFQPHKLFLHPRQSIYPLVYSDSACVRRSLCGPCAEKPFWYVRRSPKQLYIRRTL